MGFIMLNYNTLVNLLEMLVVEVVFSVLHTFQYLFMEMLHLLTTVDQHLE